MQQIGEILAEMREITAILRRIEQKLAESPSLPIKTTATQRGGAFTCRTCGAVGVVRYGDEVYCASHRPR